MLAKLWGAARRAAGDDTAVEQQPAERPPEMPQFEPMVPLRPPPAQNDDGMQRFCEGVEEALREAGYLR